MITKSNEETQKIAREIGEKCKGGEVFVLDGDLGAGKTVFAKGLAQGLQVNAIVNSPTFTILNVYKGRLSFYHFDMYRIDDINELQELGFDEFIGAKDSVCAIEWASKTPTIIPKNAIKILIKKVDENTREIIWEMEQ